MAYKSAIVGCGARAAAHAQAYQEGLDEVRLQAICDIDRAKLDAFGDRFNIAARYESLEQMIGAERPDIVHIVTMPQVREQPIETAAQLGVKGILVEKPIALFPSQVEKIKDTARRTGVKIAVNMQRRYFPSCEGLKEVLERGRIGELLFVRVVAKGNILSMGPHLVDLLLFFLGDTSPSRAWACANGMNGYKYKHPAPANMMIRYVFPDNLVVYCEDAEDCVGTPGETNYWQHLEYDFWGAAGRAWWTQNRDWGYIADGMAKPHVLPTSWAADDVPGQREFTRAMAHWLDDTQVHRNCLENSLIGFDMIMAALLSAYLNKDVVVPSDITDEIVVALERRLSS